MRTNVYDANWVQKKWRRSLHNISEVSANPTGPLLRIPNQNPRFLPVCHKRKMGSTHI